MFTTVPAIILDTLLKTTLLLGLAWGATLLLRRHSASLRHMVRVFTLAALLLLPLSVLLLPAWHVKGVPDFTRRAAASVSPAAANTTANSSVAAMASASSPEPAKSWRRAQPGAESGQAASLPVMPAQPGAAAAPVNPGFESGVTALSAPQPAA